jgi:hypothetical protein
MHEPGKKNFSLSRYNDYQTVPNPNQRWLQYCSKNNTLVCRQNAKNPEMHNTLWPKHKTQLSQKTRK